MLVAAAEFLTYREAVALYAELRELGLVALVKTCGPPTFPFGEGMYYQLLLDENALVEAREVLETFARQRTQAPELRCPKCGSPGPLPVVGVAWWKRLFYAGTTLHKCTSCGKEFPA
ncbi:hypothetical protein [Hymenobacter fodinae]|uniref:DUF2007 domain-containing protein n=1 Tax=Hymenobacter fodinae TaxID=2510796 RepID=A0A4Z0P138_9BACT|nr:hypothetical protein [Hymenobacter fodinae]TGE04876.1 hypothetical protein EU556_22115 [Hymenobacter fodinae]